MFAKIPDQDQMIDTPPFIIVSIHNAWREQLNIFKAFFNQFLLRLFLISVI